jgi:hypothetical protein
MPRVFKGICPDPKFDWDRRRYSNQRISWGTRAPEASEGYILGTGQATPMILPHLVLLLATQLLHHSFCASYLERLKRSIDKVTILIVDFCLLDREWSDRRRHS